MTIATVRRRINALSASLRVAPSGLDVQFGRLSPHDQSAYCYFAKRRDEWITAHPDCNYYEHVLADDAPSLPDWLARKFSNSTVRITQEMTERQAQAAYHKLAFGD